VRLAWAITVHKSQGMTLDAAEIDLSRAFDKGMGYVALSRVKRLENISLLGLNTLALQVSDRIKTLDADFLGSSLETETMLSDLGAHGTQSAHAAFLAKITADEEGGGRKKSHDHGITAYNDDYSYEPAEDLPVIDFEF
jgi:hypothetical protein